MRTLLTIILLLLSIGIANAQTVQSKITLKNGTVITGVVKSIDPADALTITIGTVDMNVKMTDVAKIESINENNNGNMVSLNDLNLSTKKLIVTDNADYPESFDLKIGKETLKMILVRGGDLKMGFNGKHSISMNSEPVHRVGVTSFYMSDNYVTNNIIGEVTGKPKKSGYYKSVWWNDNDMATSIAVKLGLSVRLPTEAEWEYAACSSVQDKIFNKCKDFEYCRDFFGDYTDEEYKVDPKGPDNNKNDKHVIRAYSQEDGKFSRKGSTSKYCFRLVIKAKDIK